MKIDLNHWSSIKSLKVEKEMLDLGIRQRNASFTGMNFQK